MDKRAGARLLRGLMQSKASRLVTPVTLLVDAVLVIAFFLYMYSVVSGHVPSKDHRMVLLWGSMGSACLTLVFWLSIQMIRVVARHQSEITKG